MADGVWKGVYHQVFGYFRQLLHASFFEQSIPSMGKVDGKEKTRGKGGGRGEEKKRKECNNGYSGH